jgi:type VI secretion system protein ImpH
MAGTSGQTSDLLKRDLAEQPWRYDFFQAVRLLECAFAHLPRVGWAKSPAQEAFRFAQQPDLAFPPATVREVRLRDPDRPPVLFAQFFGLFGPNGALPHHLTEYARERELHHGDRTFAAFLNVFHHRMFAFFYRAWAGSQKTVDLDRLGAPDPDDQEHFARYIGSLSGLGMESLLERDSVPDHAKLYYSGRLVTRPRNAEGLQAILEDFFGIPVRIETFAGRWLDLPADSICRVGESPATGLLGVNTIVGSRVWDCQLAFRIRLGPMRLADYHRLLPSGRAFQRVRDWVRNYCGDTYLFDVQLVLLAAEVPPLQLGEAQLGWTTWLSSQPFDHDADDLVLEASICG